MQNQASIQSSWIDDVVNGNKPSSQNLKKHLQAVHKYNPGFTEAFSSVCKDRFGRTSYKWLSEVINPDVHKNILDLACGNGPLLSLCNDLYDSSISLTGVDMSSDELLVAKNRLPKKIKLYQGIAQNLSFLENDSFDLILCHWALTLMDPIEKVFSEVNRILRSGGIFSAIVDGDIKASSQYFEINKLIYSWAVKDCKNYDLFELGDSRVRSSNTLFNLISESFRTNYIKIDSEILELRGKPDFLSKKVASFFYASYVLSQSNFELMLKELEGFFTRQSNSGISVFKIPVNRLTFSID